MSETEDIIDEINAEVQQEDTTDKVNSGTMEFDDYTVAYDEEFKDD